jgi:hypothetical protein
MATLAEVDQLRGRPVEQPGLVSQTLAFIVDAAIFGGLCAAIEAVFGAVGYWVLTTPVLFLMPYCWRRWHRSPGMALWGLYVYRQDDPDRPIGIWLGVVRFFGLLFALWLACLFLLVSFVYFVDIALLRGVHPVDSALGLRVVRYTTPPVACDLVGHAFDTAAVFADLRLTEMEHETQPHDIHGNRD